MARADTVIGNAVKRLSDDDTTINATQAAEAATGPFPVWWTQG
jgi:transposase